jgi:hypothetical protein
MATSTYLSSPVVTINAVALTGYATAATLTRTNTAQDTTVFGLNARVYSATIEDNTLTVSLFLTYEASTSVYAALATLVGTATTVSVKPTSASASATNPAFTLTNTYLESLPVINATLGTIQSVDITFKGGSYSAVIV